jgi:hypothetical protein
LGFANGQKTIGAPILNEVLEDLDLETLGSGTVNELAVLQQAECEGSVDPSQLLV